MRNRHILLAFAALALGLPVQGQANPTCPAQPATLEAMRNCFRPVLVFAPNSRDRSFVAQKALLEQYADDMMDRDLLYVPVLAARSRFEAPLDAPYVLLKQTEMNAIRARFGVRPSEYLAILMGRDGGEKYRTRKPVSVLKLDALVDAMPMGRREREVRQHGTRRSSTSVRARNQASSKAGIAAEPVFLAPRSSLE